MKLRVDIAIGNAAMLEPSDLAEALRDVATKLEDEYDGARGPFAIWDLNGNRVGEWQMLEDDD